MNRLKTYDSTGVAPNGRLFSGDLNALQDAVAALTDLAQNLSVGSLAIGESGLILNRYGAGEARLAGHFRIDGVFRALSGMVAGAYTNAQRNALSLPSYGLIILNTDTNQYEWNSGTSAAPVWKGISGGTFSQGTLASRPGASPTNANSIYLATDTNGGTLYASTGSTWVKVAAGLTEAPTIADGSLTPAKIAGTAVVNADARLSDARTPLAHAASHHPSTGADKITMSLYGTAAARPAATAVADGTLYRATDTGVLSQAASGAWATVYDPTKNLSVVTAFPSSPFAGQQIFISPVGTPEKILMTYDGNLSKWLSEEYPVSCQTFPSRGGVGGDNTYDVQSTLTDRFSTWVRYREFHSLGMRIQTDFHVAAYGTNPQAWNCQTYLGFNNDGNNVSTDVEGTWGANFGNPFGGGQVGITKSGWEQFAPSTAYDNVYFGAHFAGTHQTLGATVVSWGMRYRWVK